MTTTAREGVGDGDGRDGGYVAAEEFSVKEEFEAIRRELAEIKSNMSSPATAAATPNGGGGGGMRAHFFGGTPGGGFRTDLTGHPWDRSAALWLETFTAAGASSGSSSSSSGAIATRSTDGGGRLRQGGSGHVGAHRSAGSSKTSVIRHRSGRKVSSEATGTGRLLFGDDDGDRSGGVGGEPASAAHEPGVGADDSVRRRGGESGAVNRRHSTGEDEAPGVQRFVTQ